MELLMLWGFRACVWLLIFRWTAPLLSLTKPNQFSVWLRRGGMPINGFFVRVVVYSLFFMRLLFWRPSIVLFFAVLLVIQQRLTFYWLKKGGEQLCSKN